MYFADTAFYEKSLFFYIVFFQAYCIEKTRFSKYFLVLKQKVGCFVFKAANLGYLP